MASAAELPVIHHTSIDLWENNKKGTSFMWAYPDSIGMLNGIPADNYPDFIKVRGKKHTLDWKRGSVVNRFIMNGEVRCLEYDIYNPYGIESKLTNIKLYLILRV